jgi:hypothetical protein
MNNFYTNMAISESFLDSAQLRDSVVSRAKELNYVPRSVRSAEAIVTIAINPTDTPAQIVIPKGMAFNARIDNDVYTFTTAESHIVTSADSYTAANVSIYEGIYVTESFLVNTSVAQKFVLNNTNIDTSSITVSVENSTTDTTAREFYAATSLLGKNATSRIFFVQAADKKRYELIFGDGVIGEALTNGNVINVTYRMSKGAIANKAALFTAASTLSGYAPSLVAVTTGTAAFGGMSEESIAAIKYNAPRHYQTQERAVTTEDFKTILLQKYPDIRAINVYGGETVYPPQYGTVFISLDLNEYDGIPTAVKEEIESFIKTKMSISIQPNVIAADYTYINVMADVSYNINLSTKTGKDIQNIVNEAIITYNDTNLNAYDVTFRYSKLAAAIDDSDMSIVSSNLIAEMIKKISPTLNVASNITLQYENPIVEYSLTSSPFTFSSTSAYFKDVGGGAISIMTSVNGKDVALHSTSGTIDYTTGKVVLNIPAAGISAYTGDGIKIYVQSQNKDFSVVKNTLLLINPDDITVNVTAVRE